MSFQVGDVVHIRSWDEMVAEFGTERNGTAISCPHLLFLDSMRYLCGKKFTIRKAEYHDRTRNSYYEFKLTPSVGFHITNFMVSKVEYQKAQIHEQIKSLFED